MNLSKKRMLAAKVLNVGKNKIIFSPEAVPDIKIAIKRSDIKQLYEQGLIRIKPSKGKRKIKKNKTKLGKGKIRKKINKRKQRYVKLTRKLRAYLKELRLKNIVNKDQYWEFRKKIKSKFFKSKANFKEFLKSVNLDINRLKEYSENDVKNKSIKKLKDI